MRGERGNKEGSHCEGGRGEDHSEGGQGAPVNPLTVTRAPAVCDTWWTAPQ